MIVAVIHKRQALILMFSSKAEGEFSRTGGKGFYADTEHLGFYARLYEVEIIRFGKDFFDRSLIAHTRAHSVRRNILVAIARPDVHNAGNAGLFGKVFGNADAGLAVVDPEASGLFVRLESVRPSFTLG